MDHNGVPYVKRMADIFSSKFPISGTVIKVTERSVTVQSPEGEEHTVKLVENLPYNQKGFQTDDPHKWKVGDKVEAGQTVTDNNFTKNGVLAIGKNLQTAYMAYKGFNNEDGIVISRSAAESMTSNHAYKESYTAGKTTVMDKNMFKTHFGKKYQPEQLTGFDSKGLPSKGRQLHYGDPIALIMEERQHTDLDKVLGRLHKTLVSPYRDASLIWDHHEIGEIVDVNWNGKNLTVLIRSEKTLGVGDKISGKHGNKG